MQKAIRRVLKVFRGVSWINMKRRSVTLTLALSALLFNAPLALAEETPQLNSGGVSVGTETTPSEVTLETGVSTTPVVEATEVPETTEVAEAQNEPGDITESGVSEEVGPLDNTDDSATNTGVDLPPVLDENGEVVSPGTLPDSPFYWLTLLIEKLEVILTFDPVEKTQLLEEQALERIAEAQALIEEGDTYEAESALQAYTEKVIEAQAFIATLAETDSEMMQKLETALSNTRAQNVQTLGGLLDKLPPQASQKVALNIVRSMEKAIVKMEKKDQQKVAKALRKATQGVEDIELAEEDQEALENLEQVLDSQEVGPEETVVANSSATLTVMASSPSALEVSSETSKTSQQSVVKKPNRLVEVPKTEAKIELEPVKLQKPEVLKDTEKEQAQKKTQEGTLATEKESTSIENVPSSDNSTPKTNGGRAPEKAQKDRENGGKSGGKER
jgi:hypothetical protein